MFGIRRADDGRDPASSDEVTEPTGDALVGDRATADETIASSRTPRRAVGSGWGAVFRRNRLIWLIAAVAVVALVAGLAVGRFIISPADAAASEGPPDAGLVTVPVAFGELSNDVTIRGEVAYADSVEVQIDTSGIEGPAVVTGQVPAVAAELAPLSVALEIAGRPVIVLPGDLPSYRTLRFGVSGPDVVQYKTAMRAIGIDAGDPANNVFDSAAASAVTALYAQAGYPAPATEDGGQDAIRAAQEGVRSAQQAIADAKAALATARAGASVVDIREADNAVASAQRQLDAARAEVPQDAVEIADLADALGLAQLRRQQLNAAPDVSSQRSAVDSATAQLTDAQAGLARAQQDALPTLPAGEVLYLSQLPRRVDAVSAVRGTVLSGSAMTVSGATLGLSGSASEADAELLKVGDEATFAMPDGSDHRAVISEVLPGTADEPRWTIRLAPDPLTPEEIQLLQGTNVRVAIAVGATEGEVLSVPLAALTAGPGGETRVEVVDGDPRDGTDAETHLVVVESGLAASGAVEVRPVDGGLEEGDLVVVGT